MSDNRNLLIKLLNALKVDEGKGLAGDRLSRGVRYDLAVRATDINGDGCRFPACGCQSADCSKGRMSLAKPYDGSEWDNRRGRRADA